MVIKISEIVKSESVNAVGNITFTYNIVDAKGVIVASETTVMSINFDNVDMKQIAMDFLADAETKEYEARQKAKADNLDIEKLKIEIEKQIIEKMDIEAVTP